MYGSSFKTSYNPTLFFFLEHVQAVELRNLSSGQTKRQKVSEPGSLQKSAQSPNYRIRIIYNIIKRVKMENVIRN